MHEPKQNKTKMIYLNHLSVKVNYLLSSIYSNNKQKEVTKIPHQYFLLPYYEMERDTERIKYIKRQVADYLFVQYHWNDFANWKIQQWIQLMEYLVESQENGEIDKEKFDRCICNIILSLNYLKKENYLGIIKNQFQLYFKTERQDGQMRGRWAVYAE